MGVVVLGDIRDVEVHLLRRNLTKSVVVLMLTCNTMVLMDRSRTWRFVWFTVDELSDKDSCAHETAKRRSSSAAARGRRGRSTQRPEMAERQQAERADERMQARWLSMAAEGK